jgi:putative Ca2+/H+ antiporter (TMEM165/GDT1 family)
MLVSTLSFEFIRTCSVPQICSSDGNRFARKLPMRAIHVGASVLFVTLGLFFVLRAFGLSAGGFA